jgi:uncharacterized protein (DUF1499 family)
MTAATAPRPGVATGLARIMAIAGFVLAILALLLLAAGPIGWRAGWWHYRIGLLMLMPAAGFLGAAAAILSALGLVGLRRLGRRQIALAVVGILIGAAVAYVLLHWVGQRGSYAQVNDVTTDFVDPPSLAFAEAMRRSEEGNPVAYAGDQPADVQKNAYPDIVPAMLDMPPAAAFDKVLAVVRAKGWTIVTVDRAAGVIDAYDRSLWFGFTDDIAIRVTPSGERSRVDIRSGARQGRGDFGVNAARVRGFLAALKSP